jgi:hypothetical protein
MGKACAFQASGTGLQDSGRKEKTTGGRERLALFRLRKSGDEKQINSLLTIPREVL